MTGPTILTIMRMFLSIIFMVFALLPYTWARIVALTIFIVASLTDLIDGKWARKKKVVTDLGAFLDPLADKMLINLAFLVLVCLEVVPIWVFAIILVRDFAVDGMRMMAARKGITISASFYGKLKTTIQMTALIIIMLNLIVNLNFFTILGNIALYLALILTVFSGGDYLIKGWKKVIK
ncbi:CDP-diacylglycerol--glycerol-3-phosphate 3-phosphatidyltransferase [Candidatus Saccharibacteria bacterium]|nr:CDP-diacylglycerol--glycerol-3-phosphate 3-phosphatidyltransferase [Candidatus Saccharibacteria bacterium]